jgi:hypothetical protein
LLHRNLSNTVLTTGIDDVDALKELKKCVKRGICCLVVLLWLRTLLIFGGLVCWKSCAVFDPAFSEQPRSRFSYFLVSITQTPSEKLFAMRQA